MLRAFRSKLSSWLMLGVLGIAVIALVITGFGTGGAGGLPGSGAAAGGETVVKVGDSKITANDVERTIRQQFEQARRQNPQLDMGSFLASGAFDAILNQMIVGQALYEFGREQGLVASDRMIDTVIANIPDFQNFAGQFDEGQFRQALANQNITERQLRDEIAKFLMQRQLQMPIGLSARVPEGFAVQHASLALERRRGWIGAVPADAVAQGIQPTDAEVAAFYNQNRTRYTIPERRVVRYALLGREQAAQAGRATDQEIAAYYQQNASRYAGTESRNLQQVVLQDEAAARRVAAAVQGGASLAQAAQQAGTSAIPLDGQTREQFANVSSPEVAAAAFSAAQGAVVGPVRSEFGWHVIRTEAVNRAAGRPLEAVRGEIATEIERRKVQDALQDLASRIDERVANGENFDEIVRAERLTPVETPPVTASGAVIGQQWQAPQELASLLRGAFQLDPDDPQPAIETITPNERYAFVTVGRVIPASIAPLPEIAQRVRAELVRQRGNERARVIADQIVARINGGMTATRAFAEAGVRLSAPRQVAMQRLELMQTQAEVPPPVRLLFALPQGRARTQAAPNGAGWFVVHLEQRIPGQASCPAGQQAQPPQGEAAQGCQLIEQARIQFRGQFGNEYAEQLARAAQRAVEIERDEDAIARLRQRLQAGAVQ